MLVKGISNNKASWTSQTNTHKLKWNLFFIVAYESCFFRLSPHFSSILFLFSLLSLHMHTSIRTRHISSNFLPCWLSVSSQPHLALIFTHSRGLNKKLREAMAAYLLYRCKHLCMLIFRVVSPSLTKNSIYAAYSRYNNKFDKIISVMWRMFHCSLHVSAAA